MKTETISERIDPRTLATAWALDELGAEERADFEQRLRDDPTLAALAEETKEFCGLLTGTLREPVPSLAESKRAELLAVAGRKRRSARILVPWLAAGAAACVAGGIWINHSKPDAAVAASAAPRDSNESDRSPAPDAFRYHQPAFAASATPPSPVTVAAEPPVTIRPEMPKPLFAGTPLPDSSPPPNLDKSAKPVLEVQVPAGVALTSKGKPVTCSDPAPLGELSLVTDGDKQGDDGYFVDLLPGKQWIQIDLGQSMEIHLIWMWHFHKQAVLFKDVVVQISDDLEFKTAVTVFNNDFDNSAGFGPGKDASWIETNNGRPMPVNAVTGRYVRCWSSGRNIDDTNQYIEVEVYGREVQNSALLAAADIGPALEAEREGDSLFAKQDHAGAIEWYQKGLNALPGGSSNEANRRRLVSKFANAGMLHARQLGHRGDFDKAKALVNAVLAEDMSPNHPGAHNLLRNLEDPDRFNQAMTEQQVADAEEVKRLLQKGQGYYDLGQFNEAEAEFNRTLAIDPYNTAARRSLELSQRETSNYLKAARDETRLKMLNDVDKLWITAVPGTAKAPVTVRPEMPKPLFAGTPLPLSGVGDGSQTDPNSGYRRTTTPFATEDKWAWDYISSDGIGRKAPELVPTAGIEPTAGDASTSDLASGSRLSISPGTESYKPLPENPFRGVVREPLSTFSIDVDTASYSNVRRYLNMNQAPPPEAVRLEELVNYFPYDYAQPVDGKPFAVHVEMTSAPWNQHHRLARIALKGKEIAQNERPAANLVFLVDVSGSMQPENKLPLVKQSLKFVVERLTEKDTVSLVTYAGESGVALPATGGADKARIMAAIESLGAGGSTNGAGGIATAYAQAAMHFNREGINRVILATDGDFNVGVTSHDALLSLITEKAKTGVFLSVLGYGMGNTKDDTMELLADKGNGNYAYIDSLSEARKSLADQFSGTLVTIAKDVKIQIEFNPAVIRSYRLLGYENRMLAKEDFNNDKKDAGEIGAGHTVTAIYELVPVNAPEEQVTTVDGLKYQSKAAPEPAPAPPVAQQPAFSDETMNVKLRWKAPDSDVSQLMEVPVKDSGGKIAEASTETRWAVSVGGFAALLNNSRFPGLTWEDVRALAKGSKGTDPNGYRGEFLQLIDKAEAVKR